MITDAAASVDLLESLTVCAFFLSISGVALPTTRGRSGWTRLPLPSSLDFFIVLAISIWVFSDGLGRQLAAVHLDDQPPPGTANAELGCVPLSARAHTLRLFPQPLIHD